MRQVLLVLLAVLVSGCVTGLEGTRVVATYDSTKRPKKATIAVPLLTTKPDRPYRILAEISSYSDDLDAQYQVPYRFRARAASLGADAALVVIGGPHASQVLRTERIGSTMTGGVYTEVAYFYQGYAIVWRDTTAKQ